MKIKWVVNNKRGEAELERVNHITVDLDNETITRAVAELEVPMSEKVFFNGYQSWSWSPEYTDQDAIYPARLPKVLIRRFALDRYADYHFVKYERRKGIFHGFSYCYFRDGNKFRLFASLDEDPGYTIFRYSCKTNKLTITRDCEGLKQNGCFHAFDLYYHEGSEKEVFDGWFKELGIEPPKAKRLVGYSSWYNRYEDISEQSILEDLEGCKKVLIKGNLFQVDDGWEPTVGDWLEPDKAKFPNGMKAVCDRIHAEGYLAGIWLAPFVCTKKSEIYQKHQDWLLKVNGKNWLNGSNWGGFYSLDLDNPEVIKHIRKVFKRVFDEWGFDLVKLDFLYAAAPFPSKTRSRAGKMIDAMKLLREVCKDKLILGCGVPMMPAFGLVDYCRIGCDVSLDWDDKRIMQYAHRERVSTSHSIDNTIYRRQLNNRAWINDPDVFFLRDDNIVLSKEEKQYLYAIDALMDGILLTSDNPANYSEEQIREFKEAIELREKATDIEVVYDKTPHIEYKIDGKKNKLKLK